MKLIGLSNIGINTANNKEKNPVCNGLYIVSEIDDFLKSGCHKPPLIFNLADWA